MSKLGPFEMFGTASFWRIFGKTTAVVGFMGTTYVLGLAQADKEPRLCLATSKKDGLVSWYNNCAKPVNFAVYDRSLIDQNIWTDVNYKPNVRFGQAAANEKITTLTSDAYKRSFIHECFAPQKPVLETYKLTCK